MLLLEQERDTKTKKKSENAHTKPQELLPHAELKCQMFKSWHCLPLPDNASPFINIQS